MITLYHCDGARSFRPLVMLEELGSARDRVSEITLSPLDPDSVGQLVADSGDDDARDHGNMKVCIR